MLSLCLWALGINPLKILRNISFSPLDRGSTKILRISSRLKTYCSSELFSNGVGVAKTPTEDKMRTNTNWEIVEMFKDEANKINCREHFNPRELDLTMQKIAKVRKARNSTYPKNPINLDFLQSFVFFSTTSTIILFGY